MAAVCALTLLVTGCYLWERRPFLQMLVNHQARYPLMEIQDVYKLVHQASMAGLHADADTLSMMRMLLYEIRMQPGLEDAPLCIPISPAGHLVRVQLRAYEMVAIDQRALSRAHVKTLTTFKNSPQRLERYWGYARSAASDGLLPFNEDEMEVFFQARAQEGHPPVDHSPRYLRAYQPAYRVVRRDHLPFSCALW